LGQLDLGIGNVFQRVISIEFLIFSRGDLDPSPNFGFFFKILQTQDLTPKQAFLTKKYSLFTRSPVLERSTPHH